MRKRFRIKARRQKELEMTVEPEVVLHRYLDQVTLEQHPPSEPVKRVLTPAVKAATHRRARETMLRETLCWWIAHGRTCRDGDQCNFKHVVTDEREQTVSGTGALLPGPATEQNVSGVGVSSSGPCARQEPPRGLTRDSWNDAWDKHP